MKIGIIANSDLCTSALYYLLNNKVETVLYLGKAPFYDQSRVSLQAFCRSMNIPVTLEESKEDLYKWMDMTGIDVAFVIGYRYRIDPLKVNLKYGLFNIHFGKLPEFRGPSPVFWQLRQGVEGIYLTIHKLTGTIDGGPVVWEKRINNDEHFTFTLVNQLFRDILPQGIHYIINVFLQGLRLPEKEQDESKCKYYPKPVLKDVKICWESMEAYEIVNLVRACNLWNNGAIALFNGMELKISDASLLTGSTPSLGIPGAVMKSRDILNVECINRNAIQIHSMTLNGVFVAGRHAEKFGIYPETRFY